MIGEANLIKIMRAADRDDADDVALRKLMVSALRECRADFTELLHSSTPWVGTSPASGNLPTERSEACLARAARTSAAALFTAGFAERSHRSGQRAVQTIRPRKP
jgi:hypothetical protein